MIQSVVESLAGTWMGPRIPSTGTGVGKGMDHSFALPVATSPGIH